MSPSDKQQPTADNQSSPDKSSLHEKKNGKRKAADHTQQTTNNKPIPLFYWSERKFTFKDKENYGDFLSEYLVEKITGKSVKFVHPKKQAWYKLNKKHYLGIGSILHHATKESVVWGSGIIDRVHSIAPANFKAVRGPQTRNFLLKLGYECPEVYGDPALLLPLYYNPEVKKRYRIGIIPHYHDYREVLATYRDQPEVTVIDMMTMNVETVTRQFLQCERTISSSLHGIIVSHAYQIPSVWVEFSNKLFGDGIKFPDYLESIKLPVYSPEFLKEKRAVVEIESLIEEYPALPNVIQVRHLQKGLMESCPFI